METERDIMADLKQRALDYVNISNGNYDGDIDRAFADLEEAVAAMLIARLD